MAKPMENVTSIITLISIEGNGLDLKSKVSSVQWILLQKDRFLITPLEGAAGEVAVG